MNVPVLSGETVNRCLSSFRQYLLVDINFSFMLVFFLENLILIFILVYAFVF